MPNMTNFQDQIHTYLFEGTYKTKHENPWIAPFLDYIANHPSLKPDLMSEDLFGDNGTARKRSIENILYIFDKQGLIKKENNRYTLTEIGETARKEKALWEGKKGCFSVTTWEYNDAFWIIAINEHPTDWFGEKKSEGSPFAIEKIETPYFESTSSLDKCREIFPKENAKLKGNLKRNGIEVFYEKEKIKFLELEDEILDELWSEFDSDEDEE